MNDIEVQHAALDFAAMLPLLTQHGLQLTLDSSNINFTGWVTHYGANVASFGGSPEQVLRHLRQQVESYAALRQSPPAPM